MKIKRILLLALIAAVLASLPAYAAQGNKNLIRQGEMEEKYSDYHLSSCVAGDTLYIAGRSTLLLYRGGDAEPTALKYDLPDAEENMPRSLQAIFSAGGRLCGLFEVLDAEDSYRLVRLEIAEITVDGGEVRFGAPREADASELTVSYGSDYTRLGQIDDAVGTEDALYLLVWADSGENLVYAMNLEDGRGHFLDVKGACGIAPWTDGGLLIETYDFSEWRCGFLIYDPAADRLTPACDPLPVQEELCGIAYSPETRRLFYLDGGYVMAATDFDFAHAEPVAELSASCYGGVGGDLLPGDLYVYSTYDLTAVRATDPGALPEKRLVVYGSSNSDASMNAYYDFTERHSDVAVIQGGNGEVGGPDEISIIEAMLGHDASVDIYKVSVASEDYAALFARGYMAELTSETLADAVAGMYPPIRDAVTRGGAPVAIPINAFGWLQGFDMEGFEKIGIPREELPDNWPDLLALLPQLPERLPEDGSVHIFDSYSTQQDVRYELTCAILDSWRRHLQASGQELRCDAPELKSLLECVMEMDLEAMGVPEDSDMHLDLLDASEEDRTLIHLGSVGCTIGNFYDSVEPVTLSAIPGQPAQIPVRLTVAFINPYSENIDLAQEYLEALYANLDTKTLYNLSGALNEPVRMDSYDEDLAHWQDALASAREELEKAEPVDKPGWEREVASAEQQLRDLEAYGWVIPPEELAWYRAHAESLFVEGYNPELDIYELFPQLAGGQMDVDALLKEIDRKVRMREKEGF